MLEGSLSFVSKKLYPYSNHIEKHLGFTLKDGSCVSYPFSSTPMMFVDRESISRSLQLDLTRSLESPFHFINFAGLISTSYS